MSPKLCTLQGNVWEVLSWTFVCAKMYKEARTIQSNLHRPSQHQNISWSWKSSRLWWTRKYDQLMNHWMYMSKNLVLSIDYLTKLFSNKKSKQKLRSAKIGKAEWYKWLRAFLESTGRGRLMIKLLAVRICLWFQP